MKICEGWNCLMTVTDGDYCAECQHELANDEIRGERQEERNEIESDTPRTDEKERTEYDNQGNPYDEGVVDADFARQLERELAEALTAHVKVCEKHPMKLELDPFDVLANIRRAELDALVKATDAEMVQPSPGPRHLTEDDDVTTSPSTFVWRTIEPMHADTESPNQSATPDGVACGDLVRVRRVAGEEFHYWRDTHVEPFREAVYSRFERLEYLCDDGRWRPIPDVWVGK